MPSDRRAVSDLLFLAAGASLLVMLAIDIGLRCLREGGPPHPA